MPSIIRHVMVTGRVQGVGYRAWAGDQAILLGLQGWVRNLRDGSVEAMFSGPKDAVMQMIDMCHRGPPPARVDHVVVSDALPDMLKLRSGSETFSQLASL
jgi:acylphosphatase